MMVYDQALQYTMLNEGCGKYTENPTDNGGPTKWGVTQKTLSAYWGRPVSAADVKALTIENVTPLYKSLYWDVNRCGEIKSEAIARAVFDSSVLFGPVRAAKALQSAINVVADAKTKPLAVDGRLGAATIAALNAQSYGLVLQAYVTELEEAVTDIVKGNPKQIVFLAGWLRRLGAYLVLQFTCATTTTQAVG